ncbi:hypothetical protein Nepgr_017592 [Nepenthes gracilis]|uniref:BAH domain-containing protein n=1 Tax=Nepenthes gracilis TaxID=150966 RepID=A0AAD3XTI1_NEPGR|nr:hypothetical protein Nepgr_017592 [Nepenthes gracilis]
MNGTVALRRASETKLIKVGEVVEAVCIRMDGFVAWEEQIISQEKGNRLVHFFLKDPSGNSVLAVIGTERSIRHMVYVVSDKFVEDYGPMTYINFSTKWRARREVIDWLTLLVTKHNSRLDSRAAAQMQPTRRLTFEYPTAKAHQIVQVSRKLKTENSDIMWSGAAWNCSKQLTHYPCLCRNGAKISAHSFVSIMAAEGDNYLGYIEDLYEDKKGQKKVKVRWFHHGDEDVGTFSQLNAHPKEVFITPQVQVISAECILSTAAILTPKHYEQCLAVIPQIVSCRLKFCFRQLNNNIVKPFILSKLHGYSRQPVLSCLNHPLYTMHSAQDHKSSDLKEKDVGFSRHGTKRNRASMIPRPEVNHPALGSKFTRCQESSQKEKFKLLGRKLSDGEARFCSSFKVSDKIELLCQDSGIRGCWFRCKILRVSRSSIKVQYEDLQDAEESGNLEEWVPASRVAAPDKVGMRCPGRLTIRPHPPKDSAASILEVGAPVDAWWCDGWWEGVVMAVDFCARDYLQVYLPGEDKLLTVEKQNIRISRDWINGGWVTIKTKPDIHAYVSANLSHSMKPSFRAEASMLGGCPSLDHPVPPIPGQNHKPHPCRMQFALSMMTLTP